jgi:hypothetical protein
MAEAAAKAKAKAKPASPKAAPKAKGKAKASPKAKAKDEPASSKPAPKAKAKAKAASAAPAEDLEGTYAAGEFRTLKTQWIRETRAATPGLSFKDAQEQWKQSAVLKHLMAGLSEAERKRRRFS